MMNERIRELAKQAGDYVNGVYTPLIRSKTSGKMWEDGHVDWHTQFNQKFAELIVRECMMLVEGFESTQEVALDEYVDYEASSVLKQHFGVEL